jgi:histone acetyltransferase (RNA polymerase elongator complex component)
MHDADEKEIRTNIESYLKTSCEAFVEIGFYGGSFTGIPIEEQKKYLEIGYSYVRAGRVNEMRLSTRPDYINDEILNNLENYGVKTIELGVQSLHDDVLKASCRGHSSEIVTQSAEMIKRRGFTLGIQTMVGLPGDTNEKAIDTAHKVIHLSPEIVRIYPTLVIRNTYLEKMYMEGSYKPLSVDDAVSLCAELLKLYEENNINVIRIGLQPTDNISESGEVIAGPFHPAFRQLVQAKLLLNKMVSQITDNGLAGRESIIIECNPKNIANVIGQKKCNIKYLKSRFEFKNIQVVTSESVPASIIFLNN